MAVLESEFAKWEGDEREKGGRGQLQEAFEWECIHQRSCDKCKHRS
jgi:hypothetical protein